MASIHTQLPIEAPAPAGLTLLNKTEPVDAHQAATFRDSRLLDCQSSIPEEDESNETASEPAEPLTPTSDAPPHAFHHEENCDTGVDMPRAETQKLRPLAAQPPRPQTAPRIPSTDTAPQLRQGLGKRVGSFVRNRLHRTPSAEPPQQFAFLTADVKHENNGIAIPTKPRRLSSFSLPGRNSPKSSRSNTPPSPRSPSSTISHDAGRAEMAQAGFSSKHSQSSTGLSSMISPRHGITWSSSYRGDGTPSQHPRRRRSASNDQVPTLAKPSDGTTVGLVLDTFSRAPAEGVGMKARRLSTSLPDEFTVDYVELDSEFKSSSLMPGKRGKLLGKGATAQVRIMARRGAVHGEELVAVKEFRDREQTEDERDYNKKIKSEYSIAKSLHHPNIVETVRLCVHNGTWNHVMEYCNYGEIYSLVERKLFAPDGYYSLNDRLCLFKQLIRGVDYLHSHGIAHRDIKLENLLLSKDGYLKISDFGVAEVFSGVHPGLRAAGGECGKNMGELRLSKPGICGSLPYIAPEVLEKKGSYDPRPLDVWSCAIVFLTMTCGGCPWQAAKPEWQHYAKFKSGWDKWLATHPDGLPTDDVDGFPKCGKLFTLINPPPIKRLLIKMLHPLPDKRIQIRDIVNLSYFKNIECCCPETFEDREPCCIDTSKAKKGSSKMVAQKKHLHRHIPPKPEKRVAKAFQHRFDMGSG